MKEPYLWDRSGDPDPEVQRLEEILGQFRPTRPLEDRHTRVRSIRHWTPHAIAACLVLGAAVGLLISPLPQSRPTEWQIVRVDGRAESGAAAARAATRLGANETLRTESGAYVSLEADDVGRIDVEPATALSVAESTGARQMIHLQRGTIHALIWAPPRRFVVDTPSSRAIDLGCKYTLTVDASGDGLLRVEFGWVAFQFRGREAFIPAGAVCRTSKGRGPATPYYARSSELFRDAVDAYDRNQDDAQALREVLLQASADDAMTLWHLLAGARAGDRARIFDRFVELAGTPPGVTRDGVIAGDRTMMDRCWNALNLMDVEFWRGWRREWTPNVTGSRAASATGE